MRGEGSEFSKLARVVERLTSSYRVHAVILFGSRAHGDHKPWSDYDILVVADFGESYLERIGRLLDLLSDVGLNVEPHPYTLSEAIEMPRRGSPTIVDALSEGIVLYSGERFQELEELYRKLVERGLRRSETSIILPPEDT